MEKKQKSEAMKGGEGPAQHLNKTVFYGTLDLNAAWAALT
jgi:hypothetical protein